MSVNYTPVTPPLDTGRRSLRIVLFLVILATVPFYCVGFLLISLPQERIPPTPQVTGTLPPAARTATPTLLPTSIPLQSVTPISPLLPTPGQFIPGGVAPPVFIPTIPPVFIPTPTVPFIPQPTAAPTLTPFPTDEPPPQPTATTLPFFPTDTETPTATATLEGGPPPPGDGDTSPGGANEDTGNG